MHAVFYADDWGSLLGQTCLALGVLLRIENSLVKFLHSGDPDIIQTCGWRASNYSYSHLCLYCLCFCWLSCRCWQPAVTLLHSSLLLLANSVVASVYATARIHWLSSYPCFWHRPNILQRTKMLTMNWWNDVSLLKRIRGHSDLNQGPIGLQPIALPLSYIPSCADRESNPGRKNGNLAWYHYTSGAVIWKWILT